jgi:RNA polymerase sigma factor (sigma-70 family)
MDLAEHLFRREWSRMVAALTRVFGVQKLALAEDVVQEAFCRAVEVWSFRGIPDNPSAWLMATAKHCAFDLLRRERTARRLASELDHYVQSGWTLAPLGEDIFGADIVKDDLLRMMFSCCDPRLSQESQIALILNILCGFGIAEVAGALIGSHSAVEKRITRAKKSLAESNNLFDVASPKEFAARLPTVQRALYLLFNEGYHGASPIAAVRAELCREAMRLTAVVLDHQLGATPESYALSALMCLNAARLPGRVDALGELQSLADQNRSLWDRELIREGLELLGRSATGATLSEYHIEAAIAAIHTSAANTATTDWKAIAALYDALMSIQPSPIVALNRAIAIAQAEGPERGLSELSAIPEHERLGNYPFFHAALGELESRRNRHLEARHHFDVAASKARSPMEQEFLKRRARECTGRTAIGP